MTDQIDPSKLLRRGAGLLKRGKHNQALEVLQEAYAAAPDDFDISLNLAAANIMAKKFKQAIGLLEPLIETHGDNANLWTNLGAAYLGNPVLADDERQYKAVQAFVRALEIDPQVPNVAYNIGLIFKDRREYPVAKQWFEIALQVNSADSDAQYWLDEVTRADAEND